MRYVMSEMPWIPGVAVVQSEPVSFTKQAAGR